MMLLDRIDHGLELEPLAKAAAGRRCLGMTRFHDCGEDYPDMILTCLWRGSSVLVEFVVKFRRTRRGSGQGSQKSYNRRHEHGEGSHGLCRDAQARHRG